MFPQNILIWGKKDFKARLIYYLLTKTLRRIYYIIKRKNI